MSINAEFATRWPHALLIEKATEWQRRLRLADWTINVEIWPERDMDAAYGICKSVVEQKQIATIVLLDPADFVDDGDYCEPYDPEVTIVHELLHIYTGRMVHARKTPEDVVAEQLAHHLACLLVEQEREIERLGGSE